MYALSFWINCLQLFVKNIFLDRPCVYINTRDTTIHFLHDLVQASILGFVLIHYLFVSKKLNI